MRYSEFISESQTNQYENLNQVQVDQNPTKDSLLFYSMK
ncbi:hypothetical protein Murru_1951 [Allomuricauda ruestringensis DSM 13258]|uniref:Uncharacterized protein n=1 Tax=Allomuricauda ruestringensis (strain DSM 13258 / CIP 107369 / LMG 19739 / B1) TaxID=886377 RepID=G2PKH1_ALLRU|nr:hypothetical protein Murru_1951 [Allomuricauda ruestringensis DSM 13258]